MTEPFDNVGVVVIGRNEGERLKRCLRSMDGQAATTVYVDSGSTDGSVPFAESLGVHVLNLDLSVPFTMARGRNEGFRYLLELQPGLEFVQFVDGDCMVEPGWLEFARAGLREHPDAAAVAGRRREQFPEHSIYNRLADIEWNAFTPGEVDYCGGDAMYRSGAFQESGGFNPGMIAGEEPELCYRLREAGWKIYRFDQPMTRHDAAMTRFGQWWKRAIRGGHASAELASLHPGYKRRELRRCWIYALAVPALALLPAWPTYGLSLLLLLFYPVQGARIYRAARREGLSPRDAALYAASCVLVKFPEILGIMKFKLDKLRKRQSELIEYK